MNTENKLPADKADALDRLSHLELMRINAKLEAVKEQGKPLSKTDLDLIKSSLVDIGTLMFVNGQRSVLNEVSTSSEVAQKLNISEGLVRRLAVKLQVGKKIGYAVWLFTPQDVETMRDRNKDVGRPGGWTHDR